MFVVQISRNRFPFENDIVLESVTLNNFVSEMKELKGLDLKKAESRELLGSKFNNPEVLIALLSVFFMILMAIVSAIEIEGVELAVYETAYEASDGTRVTRSFAVWQVAGYAILLVLSVYFVVSTARIFVRKIGKVANKGQAGSLFDALSKHVS